MILLIILGVIAATVLLLGTATATVIITGFATGTMNQMNTPGCEQPSIRAASGGRLTTRACGTSPDRTRIRRRTRLSAKIAARPLRSQRPGQLEPHFRVADRLLSRWQTIRAGPTMEAT